MPESDTPTETVDEGTDGWRCPITGDCSKSKVHRVCNSDICEGEHCWDCCEADQCGCEIDCPEPSMDSIDYDLPDGESLT